jgi:hypothetical protein
MELNRRPRPCASVDQYVKVSHEFNVKRCEEEAARQRARRNAGVRSPATVCRFVRRVSQGKPFEQREFTVGLEHAFDARTSVSVRYVHKNVVRAVEDVSIVDPVEGEKFFMANPGSASPRRSCRRNAAAGRAPTSGRRNVSTTASSCASAGVWPITGR